VIIDPAVGIGRPAFVTFGGVVVNDVQPHLYARFMKRSDHLPKLSDRIAHGIALMGCEKAERHVTPVVALLRIKLMHRHQLDHGDFPVPSDKESSRLTPKMCRVYRQAPQNSLAR